MLAFILLASRLGRPVAASDVAKCTRYDLPELAFEPDQYLGWHSMDRRLYLFAWQAFSEQGQIGSHWHVDHDEVVLFSGMPVPLDTPWTPGIGWAEQLATRIAASDANTVATEFGGAFTLMHLRRGADSLVTNDLLGGAPLYWDASQEILVVSNRANLVASVWGGSHPVRDWRGPAAPIFAGASFGPDTGLKDVAALAPGAWWDLGWKKRPEERQRPSRRGGGDPADRIEPRCAEHCAPSLVCLSTMHLALDAARQAPFARAAGVPKTCSTGLAHHHGSAERPCLQIAAELADRWATRSFCSSVVADPDEFSQQGVSCVPTNALLTLGDERRLARPICCERIRPGCRAGAGESPSCCCRNPHYDPASTAPPIADFFATRLGGQGGRTGDDM